MTIFIFVTMIRIKYGATTFTLHTETQNTVNNNNNISALQPLVGFGFLHNASLACFVPLQLLTPIIAKVHHDTVNHLVCGHPFLILENNHPFSIPSGNCSSKIFITCPSHLTLCAVTNLTMSHPSNCPFNSTS